MNFNHINKNKIALVLTLEENKEKLYEYECMLNIEAWRKTKHYLSDIDILVYVNKKQHIKNITFNIIKSYPNVYIIYYDTFLNNPFFNLQCNAINMFYSRYYFEKNQTKYDFGIFLDLDMYILKDFHINSVFKQKNMFCIYSKKNLENINTTHLHWKKYFNSIRLNHKLIKCSFYILNRHYKIVEETNKFIYTKEFNQFFLENQYYKGSDFFYNEALFDYAWYTNVLNYNNSILVDDFYMEKYTFRYAPFMHEHILTFNDYHKLRKKIL